MRKLPWFKLYTEIRTDPKMQALTDSEFRLWIYALCLASESKVRGVICMEEGLPYPPEVLAKAMGVEAKTWEKAVEQFVKLRLVAVQGDGSILLLHFDCRQYDKPSDLPEAVKERKKRYQERLKQAQTAKQTPQERLENAPKKEGEKDKKPGFPPSNPPQGDLHRDEGLTVQRAGMAAGSEACEQPPMTPGDQGFAAFWAAYPRKIGKKAAQAAWRKLKPAPALQKKILAAIAQGKTTAQWQREQGRYIPNPATWLKQERWEDEYEAPLSGSLLAPGLSRKPGQALDPDQERKKALLRDLYQS